GLRMDVSKMPVSSHYTFDDFSAVVYDVGRYYVDDVSTQEQRDRAQKITGPLAALFMMMEPSFVHQRMAAYLRDEILPDVDKRLQELVAENAEDIKRTRELFHHMGSAAQATNLEAQDVTLDALSSVGAQLPPHRILRSLMVFLKATIKNRVVTAISDELDSAWKVVPSVPINFDD
ncbi:unnamed protein product, partial [marine sediment metagenome]